MKNYGDKGTLSFKLTKNILTFVTTIRDYKNSNHGKNTKTWNNSTKYHKQNNVGSGAEISASGLSSNNSIIVPLTCLSTWVQFVFSVTMTVTLYRARVVTVKFLSLMSSSETVLSTP